MATPQVNRQMNWESICQWICALTRNWHTKIDSSSFECSCHFFFLLLLLLLLNGQHTSFLHWFKHTRWRRQAKQANSIFKLNRLVGIQMIDSIASSMWQPQDSQTSTIVCKHWLAACLVINSIVSKTQLQCKSACCLYFYFLKRIWIELWQVDLVMHQINLNMNTNQASTCLFSSHQIDDQNRWQSTTKHLTKAEEESTEKQNAAHIQVPKF